ncbi:MAG: molybdenum cofactor biosynthesis protein MoaE [SAR202 cluster bacterium]|nr:molybdenum cofactor biosynthesis protein MoaE [SAR202 cluster bacterium]|tara:strand:- start:22790 stop:23212 length:423 start_codon:yes stop_codon:yes gene_type:complete
MIHITSDPLEPNSVTEIVRKNSNGAVITFLGTTRDSTDGKNVNYLEYEAYQPMAQNMIQQIFDEVKERWEIEDLAISHRLGKVEIGEISMVVAISSPHRKQAFEAGQYSIDRIKEIVPIWKKEFFDNGEEWVGSETQAKP